MWNQRKTDMSWFTGVVLTLKGKTFLVQTKSHFLLPCTHLTLWFPAISVVGAPQRLKCLTSGDSNVRLWYAVWRSWIRANRDPAEVVHLCWWFNLLSTEVYFNSHRFSVPCFALDCTALKSRNWTGLTKADLTKVLLHGSLSAMGWRLVGNVFGQLWH